MSINYVCNISDFYVSGVEKLLVSRTSAEVWQVLQDIRDEILGFVRYYPELFCVSLQFMAVTFTIHIIYLLYSYDFTVNQ